MDGDYGENSELRSAVEKKLEESGLVGNIKAQLRAAVIIALEEDGHLDKSVPLSKTKLAEFSSTNDGIKTISLVREFLQFFDMEFTLSVFDIELKACQSRLLTKEELCEELRLEHVKLNAPILVKLLKNYNFQDSFCRTPSPTFKSNKDLKSGRFEKGASPSAERHLTFDSHSSSPLRNNDFAVEIESFGQLCEDLSRSTLQTGSKTLACESRVLKEDETLENVDSRLQKKAQKPALVEKHPNNESKGMQKVKAHPRELPQLYLSRLCPLTGGSNVLKLPDGIKGGITSGSISELDSKDKGIIHVSDFSSSDGESISSLDMNPQFEYELSNDSEEELDPHKASRDFSLELRKITEGRLSLPRNLDQYKSSNIPDCNKSIKKVETTVSSWDVDRRSKDRNEEKNVQTKGEDVSK